MSATACETLGRVGREGRLELGFERRGAATVLSARRFTLPLQFLEPIELEDGGSVCAMLLNPTGGVLSGDRLETRLRLGPGAQVCVTTPSATRIYRSDGPPARLETHAEVGAGATLEYVPDHLIPHPGARVSQSLAVEVAPEGRVLLWDALALGRAARGERWAFRSVVNEITLRVGGRPAFLERVRLGAAPSGPDPAAGWSYLGTLVCLAPGAVDWPRHCETIAGQEPTPEVELGASPLAGGGLALRVLARGAPGLWAALTRAWAILRRELFGLEPADLRKG
jgi:urease accessory protein